MCLGRGIPILRGIILGCSQHPGWAILSWGVSELRIHCCSSLLQMAVALMRISAFSLGGNWFVQEEPVPR